MITRDLLKLYKKSARLAKLQHEDKLHEAFGILFLTTETLQNVFYTKIFCKFIALIKNSKSSLKSWMFQFNFNKISLNTNCLQKKNTIYFPQTRGCTGPHNTFKLACWLKKTTKPDSSDRLKILWFGTSRSWLQYQEVKRIDPEQLGIQGSAKSNPNTGQEIWYIS